MEKNQKINCTVASCKYNNTEDSLCILKAIHVSPMEGCDTKKADESMCASYEHENTIKKKKAFAKETEENIC